MGVRERGYNETEGEGRVVRQILGERAYGVKRERVRGDRWREGRERRQREGREIERVRGDRGKGGVREIERETEGESKTGGRGER